MPNGRPNSYGSKANRDRRKAVADANALKRTEKNFIALDTLEDRTVDAIHEDANAYGRQPEQELLASLFGTWGNCEECGGQVLAGTDCKSPHCMALRNESSEFYDKIDENGDITVNGATMVAGVDF